MRLKINIKQEQHKNNDGAENVHSMLIFYLFIFIEQYDWTIFAISKTYLLSWKINYYFCDGLSI